jgi:hypothetical protein
MYFSFQTQARPIVFEDPELMAMRYHLLASFLTRQSWPAYGKSHSHVLLDSIAAFRQEET